ncbi:MAG: alpha-L-arabinofuranosidase [Armatimonadetes bacterium]|nr:alpha-L-arabinofuranosidase [Armatimonadota bacterium]
MSRYHLADATLKCRPCALLVVGASMLLLSGCGRSTEAEEMSERPRQQAIERVFRGEFQWRLGPMLFAPTKSPDDTYYSVKDPSIVFHGGSWHLFVTVRGKARSHQIEYLAFTDWGKPEEATRQMLTMHSGHFCAPQVFYFEPHRKWYLVCQASDESWDPKYGAAYATTDDIADPDSWSKLRPLGHKHAEGKAGLDFWIICNDAKAHLFFTTLNGKMWREETSLTDFPTGWSEPKLAIQGDVFEASHTYRLKGLDKYLTVIEAQGGHGWRYFKAYVADRLDGEWTPVADTKEKTFASMANVTPVGNRWTDCISHGELLRVGCDQRLEVDPADLRCVFQGVLDKDRGDKPYGEIPWRLGLLAPLTAGGAGQ